MVFPASAARSREPVLSLECGGWLGAAVASVLVTFADAQQSEATRETASATDAAYHSPYDLAFAPDGRMLAVSDRTAHLAWLVDVAAAQPPVQVPLRGAATGVVWSADGSRVYVGEYGAASVAVIDAATGAVDRRLTTGRYPKGLGIAPRRGLLLVADSGRHEVTLLELDRGAEVARVRVPREPQFIAVTADESLALVGNLLPAGRATEIDHGAVVSLIDLARRAHAADVKLPAGSSSVREIEVSSDGRWAYVAHTLGRNKVPTTQLERGWVNTNALSIIDIGARALHATVLLDHPMQGAANPWGLAGSPDGATLWVALSGVHQVARIDLVRLHRFIAGGLPDDHRLARVADHAPGTESVWLRIKREPARRDELVNDLAALYSAELVGRIDIAGQGPRGLALSPDGTRLAVAVFFAGRVELLDAASGAVTASVQLGAGRAPDLERRGRMIFHDATKCFQSWLSCATCHPNDARVDGLNWDMLNDGIGNPKNLKSLLFAHRTPPLMWTGVRESFELTTAKAFLFLLREPGVGEVEAVQAYLSALRPQPSPWLAAGDSLSAAAERGRAIFRSERARCASCHAGELLTDLRRHDVGTRGELDHTGKFDTPSLIEGYRTAPYLHDGSAASFREVLVDRNQKDRHGRTAHLNAVELENLIAYLLSL